MSNFFIVLSPPPLFLFYKGSFPSLSIDSPPSLKNPRSTLRNSAYHLFYNVKAEPTRNITHHDLLGPCKVYAFSRCRVIHPRMRFWEMGESPGIFIRYFSLI
jgi:hypothetical protein